MCGIAGIFNVSGEPASITAVRRMTDAIAHRGPDGEGHLADGHVALGHRRLSIIDLTDGGRQPMSSPDGRYAITYNGEIYNYLELRAELQSKGHRFTSESDTEVLLHAYMAWGRGVLERLNGIFAFAIHDKMDGTLFLARDRYGIKPLYYYVDDNRVLFGSEVKAILAIHDLERRLDVMALREYLTFQNFFNSRTLFEGVYLLPPGSFLELTRDRVAEPVKYWDYHFEEDHSVSDAAAAEMCAELFSQAVNRQLVADVPVGSYLSGGIDSGAITAVAARQIPGMRTFTVGFDMTSASGIELGFDEREKSEYMSYLFGTEHYQMVLKSGDMERAMSRLVYHLEEPRVGQSYPNFYAAGLASRFGKVVLAGTGGDEIFGGYPWRYYRAVVNDDFDHYIDKYYEFWQRLIPREEQNRVMAPILDRVGNVSGREMFRDVFKRHADRFNRPEDYVNHSLYFEARTFLHGLLVVDDKLSMAHGLEARVPFLDNDLVDFAMRLPVRFKLGNLGEVERMNENTPGLKRGKYLEKSKDGKLLLRKVMSRYVPDQVSQAVKQGFSAPDASWYRGESINYVKDTLFDKNALIYTYLDRESVQGLLQTHLDGIQNRRLFIWSLLYLEKFLETFMSRHSTAAPQSSGAGRV